VWCANSVGPHAGVMPRNLGYRHRADLLAAFAVENPQLMGLFVEHHHLVTQEGIVDGTAATERNAALHQSFSRIDRYAYDQIDQARTELNAVAK
jgi:hypothetical protein